MSSITVPADPKACAAAQGRHATAEYSAVTFAGAPKRVPIRYRLRA
jgi:hypothetical protein